MTHRHLLAAALLVTACASAPRPTPTLAPVAAPAPAAPQAPETAWTDEPQPLDEAARRALSEARASLNDGRFDDALTSLTAAVAQHPDDVALRVRLGVLIAEDGRADDAVHTLREGVRHRPEDADLLTLAAGVRLRQALDGATIERRRGAITAHPSTDAAAEEQRVRAWLTEARDVFAEALRARPNHLGAMEGSAVVAGRLEEHAVAVRAWERIVALTHDRDAEENLARAVAASGDRPRAITLYEAIVPAEPARGEAQAALATLYEASGRADDARAARARAAFYRWIAPFTLHPSDENVAAVTTLSSWFANEDGPAPATREAEVRALLTRLGATHTQESRTLLAAFTWHHSHDALEEVAFEGLRSNGADAGDTLVELLRVSNSTCTMRQSVESLARLHDARAMPILTAALPRDTGFFPVDAANAFDLLGDAHAVPVLLLFLDRPTPPPDPDDPLHGAGYAAARARAVLALGAFDTPESRAALERFTSDPLVALEAHAALYRLTRARPHLAAIERAATPQERARAQSILTTYIERAHTPEATAAAQRARRTATANTNAARPAAPRPAAPTPRPAAPTPRR